MSFAENLKTIRRSRNITQEQLAELLEVSRQAVSKWESGGGYPETEKLLTISKELNVSLDYLLLDEPAIQEQDEKEVRSAAYAPTGKIAILSFDRKNVVVCHAVKTTEVLAPSKNEPAYILYGVDRVTFWGEHTTLLGWYQSEEDIIREIEEIAEAMRSPGGVYELKYAAEIEYVGFFKQPKLKKQDSR